MHLEDFSWWLRFGVLDVSSLKSNLNAGFSIEGIAGKVAILDLYIAIHDLYIVDINFCFRRNS